MQEDSEKIANKPADHKLNEAANNVKAGFYTLIIFAIVVAVWVYTNPFFKKDSGQQEVTVIQPKTIEKVDSIGQSFKTMWSDMVNGISNLKK